MALLGRCQSSGLRQVAQGLLCTEQQGSPGALAAPLFSVRIYPGELCMQVVNFIILFIRGGIKGEHSEVTCPGPWSSCRVWTVPSDPRV